MICGLVGILVDIWSSGYLGGYVGEWVSWRICGLVGILEDIWSSGYLGGYVGEWVSWRICGLVGILEDMWSSGYLEGYFFTANRLSINTMRLESGFEHSSPVAMFNKIKHADDSLPNFCLFLVNFLNIEIDDESALTKVDGADVLLSMS
ncbi:hypothetical protein BgiBS90_008702 [Biomphalaria glabrata]|nr:hypothetical protein BgiBS90_008702 [Biomphalaria glabrata]